jgi:SulP family sulfate permease
MNKQTVKADFIAGITVALVLIPQSMAYAQLAGMPTFYGLYAAFLPVAIAALWGSSNQLGTGPVAVVSLLTASTLTVMAVPGSEKYIALAIMLALLVGVVQLTLGLFKLGVIVNFLSHPVIIGFTNAAAIIIALSQVSKLIGVKMSSSEHFIVDIWGVVKQIGDSHIPTLLMGMIAIAIMWSIRRYQPRLPGVLIAVVVTTLLSIAIGFENKTKLSTDQFADTQIVTMIGEYETSVAKLATLNQQFQNKQDETRAYLGQATIVQGTLLAMKHEADWLQIEIKALEDINKNRLKELRKYSFVREVNHEGNPGKLYRANTAPKAIKTDNTHWKITLIEHAKIEISGGGEVVGEIRSGLPEFKLPVFNLGQFATLFSAALIISLVGFMEAISIAKAMAAKTKQRVDPNQELIGQGISNIVGSISQSFPVSGSFSRSAVNLNAGALTGMSSVYTAVFVLLTLLFLTPLLYHLPQAVLAGVIIMAVVGLVNFKGIKHAWQAHKHDGSAAIVTFIATLAFAPHLDSGIMLGAGLAIVLFLLRTMKPRVAILGRHRDGTLRDLSVHPVIPTSKYVIAMRLDGSLYFANVSYFEDTVLEAIASYPDAKFLLVVSGGINQMDASGEEVVHHLVERLKSNGVTLVFSGLKKQVLDIMRNTGLLALIGEENIFPSDDHALTAISQRLGEAAKVEMPILVNT